MKSKRAQLNTLNKYWQEHCKCELKKTATQAVYGHGSAESEVVFIGEAPGRNEDIKGVPFVGAAGKFLDEMLGIIRLKREDVYIANTVKCRPPENRDQLPEEKNICYPWLLEQIKCLQPKLIVTLGKHSMELFLPNQKISEIHGKALRREIPELGKCIFYTLYHPAAALYNGGMRETLIKDFKRIPKVLEKIKLEN